MSIAATELPDRPAAYVRIELMVIRHRPDPTAAKQQFHALGRRNTGAELTCRRCGRAPMAIQIYSGGIDEIRPMQSLWRHTDQVAEVLILLRKTIQPEPPL